MDATYLSVLNRRIRDWGGQRLHLRSVRLWFVVLVWTLVAAPITRLLLPVVAVVVLGFHTDMLSL